MRALVTGSSGHLGEALVRRLMELKHDVVGLDLLASPYTSRVGSITDRSFVKQAMKDVQAVFHTATLHKPHVVTHSRQAFVDTNITGTLNLLEESASARVESFIFTSTTSAFGRALVPALGAPAAWITEEITPIPKNIYGITKAAAEDFCRLFFEKYNLPCLILRTSRFFSEEDDNQRVRAAYPDLNAKVNEFLYRRVEIEDVIAAHLSAARHASRIGFAKYIISATTPFTPDDLSELRTNAPAVVARRVPDYEAEYTRRGWKMFPEIDRVYVNHRARIELGWEPEYNFANLVGRLQSGSELRSSLAQAVGSKGYHASSFSEGPYPVD